MDGEMYDEKIFSEFFDNQPQPLIWLTPLWDDKGAIVDFIYYYGNEKGLQYLQLKRETLSHTTIYNTPSLTNEMRTRIFEEMVGVYQTGITSQTVVYNPVIEKYGRVFRSKFRGGILVIIEDTTQETKAIHQLERQRKELEDQKLFSNSILDASSNGIFALEAVRNADNEIVDLQILKINKAFTRIIGKTAEAVEGQSFLSVFPKSKQNGMFDLNSEVIHTGIAVHKEARYEGDGVDAWFDISMVKWGENGLVVNFSDITERKKNEKEREDQANLIKTMLDASFHGKALLEPVTDGTSIIDFRVIAANNSTEKQLGIDPKLAIGKLVSQLLPAYKSNGGFKHYKEAYETGKANRYEQFYKDDRLEAWIDLYVAPIKNGVVVSFANITRQKQEALRIEHQKNLLDAIMSNSPSGIAVTEILKDANGQVFDARTILANEAAMKLSGLPSEFFLTKSIRNFDPKLFEGLVYNLAIDTLKTGKPFSTQYYLEPTKRWLEVSIAKMDDHHLINVFNDITNSKEVQIQVEQFAEKLNAVINISQAGFFLGSPVRNGEGEITDFRFTMVNQVLAAFVGKQPEELVGELGSDWFVAYKKNGLFERFRETFITGTRQQFDLHYLGETVEVWANVLTTRLGDELLGSFTDFTIVKQLQLQLEKSVEELKRSNANLQEFAYVASHDLQEPLRKIHFYSQKLKREIGAQLDEKSLKNFERIADATVRMTNLIRDLLTYSTVSITPDIWTDIELTDILDQVLQDLEVSITSTNGTIKVGRLPKVKGDQRQLRQAFQNIISNSIKYRKPDVAPEIIVTSKRISEKDPEFLKLPEVIKGNYYLIQTSDNGIGFEQEQAVKIFQVFKRLHGLSEYEGTGVGLAIVQKVISNHKGYIFAESQPGEGATFKILLPV